MDVAGDFKYLEVFTFHGQYHHCGGFLYVDGRHTDMGLDDKDGRDIEHQGKLDNFFIG